MALLSSCWLIIETILIPPGFQKWYCFGFFIHPLLLVLCQLYIWAQSVGSLLWTVVIGPLRHICSAVLWVLRFIRERILSMVLQSGTDDRGALLRSGTHEALNVRGPVQSIMLFHYYRDENILDGLKTELGNEEEEVYEEESNDSFQVCEDSEIGKPSFSFSEFSSLACSSEFSIMNGQQESESSSFVFSSEFSVTDRQQESDSCSFASSSEFSIADRQLENIVEEDVEVDCFYEKYNERMRWFDLLNHERAHGFSTISEELESSSLIESVEPISKEARRQLIRCLEIDFEMVYVAQICLCWEALHHQYRKVEGLASSSTSITGAFYEIVAGKFQQFQVLLERFMENERTGAERPQSYVQGRLSLKCLLQVPEVPGNVERESEWPKGRTIFARELMKVIETSITTFWIFIKSDSKKSPGKLRSHLCINPQVEDPRDLQLLADLRRSLHKKEHIMKNLHGRRRCPWKRTEPLDESQRLEVLFCSIDMKLVSRVLKMSVISTPQLRWCQDRLANIEFKERVVVRNQSSCLFPPS